jgi:hypothetical protein
MIFRRGQFSSVVITLTSDEPLGLLDSSFIEDDTGLDGYLTLYHVGSAQRWQMPMVALPLETPGTVNDVFTGSLPLSGLPNGTFQLRGRVRDLAGNYSTLGSSANSTPNDQILNLELQIVGGKGATIPLTGEGSGIHFGFRLTGAYLLGRVNHSRTLNTVTTVSRHIGTVKTGTVKTGLSRGTS